MQSMSNKTIIVTAGNRGGGAAVSLRFAKAGANIAIVAPKGLRADSQVNEVAEEIVGRGGKAIAVEVDLTSAIEIDGAVSKIVSCFKGIDVLINNFSTFNFKNVLETTAEEFNSVIGNAFTTFFFSKACIPHLKKASNPHVITIAPPLDMESAKAACQHHLLFSISKYGMSLCTLGMAEEFRPFGIAFNSLWQERPVSTKTLRDNFDNEVFRGSNRPEIYAEASFLIAQKPAKDFTGNFCIDETILLEYGIDSKQYAIDPTARPVKDIFLPGADYSILKL